jgi:hypothetical protein
LKSYPELQANNSGNVPTKILFESKNLELGLQPNNPTTEGMADTVASDRTQPQKEAALTETSKKRNPVRSTAFKYYIHDGVDSCRLQLIGELSETDVADLTGCWNTVRTTLASRNLILDAMELRSTDESGREWLIRMTAEGALIHPENYLRDGFALDRRPSQTRNGLLSRLVSIFRGSPAIEA